VNLFDLCVLLCISFIIFQFWRIRSISEMTKRYLAAYCDKHHLQLISVARKKSSLNFSSGKMDWRTIYYFEFSSNGEDAYVGEVELIGNKVFRTHLPAYKIS